MDGQAGTPEQHDETVQPIREWMVEYYVEGAKEQPVLCLTILRGRDVEEVQARLYHELRLAHPLEVRIEVTVTRMVPIEIDTDESLFEIEGAFQP